MKVTVVPTINKSLAIWLELDPSKSIWMQLLLPREVYKQQGINKEAQARTSPDWSPYITPSPEPVFLLTATSKLALMHSLGGLVHFDIQFLSTVANQNQHHPSKGFEILKYQRVQRNPHILATNSKSPRPKHLSNQTTNLVSSSTSILPPPKHGRQTMLFWTLHIAVKSAPQFLHIAHI